MGVDWWVILHVQILEAAKVVESGQEAVQVHFCSEQKSVGSS